MWRGPRSPRATQSSVHRGSPSGQNGTDSVILNFGSTVNLGQIVLGQQNDQNDYPGAYALYGSSDGTNFDSTPFMTGPGMQGAATTITFPVRSLRAVKVAQTGTANGSHWWSVDEVTTTCY